MITSSKPNVGDILSFTKPILGIGLICPAKLSNKRACFFCEQNEVLARKVKFHILWVPIIEPLYSHMYEDVWPFFTEKVTLNDVAKMRLNNKISSRDYEELLKHVERYANG